MSKVIWKYPLEEVEKQIIAMPYAAEVLSVQLQYQTICLWALVDPENDLVQREVIMLGTGHKTDVLGDDDIDVDFSFIGTVQKGPLVWHFFMWQ